MLRKRNESANKTLLMIMRRLDHQWTAAHGAMTDGGEVTR